MDGYTIKELELLCTAKEATRVEGLEHAALAGATACKLLSSKQHRGRAASITDIDFYVNEMPASLLAQCAEAKLIDKCYRRYTRNGLQERITYSDRSLYKFPFENQEIDIFEGSIGYVSIPPMMTQTVESPLGDLKVLNPGALFATLLQPAAVTERRAQRAKIVLMATERDEYARAVEDFTLTLRHSDMTFDHMRKAQNIAMSMSGGPHANPLYDFLQDAYDNRAIHTE